MFIQYSLYMFWADSSILEQCYRERNQISLPPSIFALGERVPTQVVPKSNIDGQIEVRPCSALLPPHGICPQRYWAESSKGEGKNQSSRKNVISLAFISDSAQSALLCNIKFPYIQHVQRTNFKYGSLIPSSFHPFYEKKTTVLHSERPVVRSKMPAGGPKRCGILEKVFPPPFFALFVPESEEVIPWPGGAGGSKITLNTWPKTRILRHRKRMKKWSSKSLTRLITFFLLLDAKIFVVLNSGGFSLLRQFLFLFKCFIKEDRGKNITCHKII